MSSLLNGLVGSMGGVGVCGDNAAMESFLTLLQERPQPATLGHPEQLRLTMITWIEKFYHRRRRQRALGKLTPIAFELPDQPATGLINTPPESKELGAVPNRSITREPSLGTAETSVKEFANRITSSAGISARSDGQCLLLGRILS